MSKLKKHIVSATLTALFIALAVVLSRFMSINLWNMSIGFSFVPLMLCGALLGPVWGGVCGALTDFIGATLFPFGAYFPGFTAVAFLSGVFFGVVGLCGRKIQKTPVFLVAAAALLIAKETICSLLLNSFWISMLYGSEYGAIILSRLPLSVVTLVLEIVFAAICRASVIPAINKNKEHF